jgi:hypothetical protein
MIFFSNLNTTTLSYKKLSKDIFKQEKILLKKSIATF